MPLGTIIVPVWRDRDALARLLTALAPGAAEIVVAAPLGESAHYASCTAERRDVRLVEAPRGRASQMNAGAAAAHGAWLVFLHADSRLPDDWLEVLRHIDARQDVVGGAFRFALASDDLRARVLERAVALRVHLLRLPYGDQAIFVRKRIFDALGGYADLPLMEDVDFVRRLGTYGRLHFPRAAVITSARRWERDGWMRRSVTNLSLAARFLAGVPASRLAQRYFGRAATAVVVMARAPWREGKSRLHLDDHGAHAALREALFLDTLAAAATLDSVDRLIACDPPDDVLRLQETVGLSWDVVAQRGDTLGDRMDFVFEDAFRLGYERVIVIGSDLPDLPAATLSAARYHLMGGGDRIVLGPAEDGGYYLVGLTRRHPELFRGIDWGTDRVLAQTREAAARALVPTVLLDPWPDVDSLDDLAALAARRHPETAAVRTRAWVAQHRISPENVE